MPELAEVFYYAKQWAGAAGKPVLRVELHPASRVYRGLATKVDRLEEGLTGAKLKQAHTHGKQMLFEFTRGHWLGVHLGMTGELRVEAQPYDAAKHDHLVLHLRQHALVFEDARQFGRIQHFEGNEAPESWLALPPQVLTDDFTARRLAEVLARHGKMPLKMLLLDQRYFPGIGNWMADEIMWQMKFPPPTPAGSLNARQVRALHRTTRKVCEVALATVGVDWSDPPQDWLFRYRWEDGHVCPRCEAELLRESLRGRTACWCPVCQKSLKASL
jgi:formamidopyrimidine-DNA glycosylase